jgi:hypothetical protein
MARNFFASLKALGAVEVMDEIPMISASLNASQSGSAMSSIKTLDSYPFSERMVESRIVPNLGRAVLLYICTPGDLASMK